MGSEATRYKIMTMHYTIKRGGAYDRFRMMLEALLERECEIHCLSLTPISIEHPLYYNHVVAFPFQRKDGVMAKCATLLLFPICGLLMGWREKVDLLVAFGPLYGFLQAMPKMILGKPMVTLIRLDLSLGSKKREWRNPVHFINEGIEYIALLFSNRIITPNATMQEEIMKLTARWKNMDVRLLFNNIPPMIKPEPEDAAKIRREFGIPENGRMIVIAGVLTPRKNVEILIRSLSKLGREDVFLVIAGGNNTTTGDHYRECLEDLVKRSGLTRRVFLPGWISKEKLWKMFDAADLFVLPSLKEGMPNVLLEALGADLPCLGSRIPGIRDILLHEALMFDPKDEKAVAAKMDRFFSDDQHSHYLMELCRERKETFTFDWKENVFQLVTQRTASLDGPH